MHINPLHAIDFYKADHRRQYPRGTQYVYSNFTARSVHHARNTAILDDFENRVVFFGLQGFCGWFLDETFRNNFFNLPLREVLRTYSSRMDRSLGVGAISTEHIAALWNKGYLPIRIKALPEGSRVNIGVPMLTIINTDPDFFWLTNYLETVLSNSLWKSCTTGTIAYEYLRLFRKYSALTGGAESFIPVQGHDFSCRGMGTIFDAASSGAAHLLSFIGTDTVAAIDYAERYYIQPGVVGVSVPATEHSVMSMGTQEAEIETFRRLITEVYPKGIVSIVSDTWDFWKVITEYAPALKNEILGRSTDANGFAKVVFRPDSGDPVAIITGDDNAAPGTPARDGAVACLYNSFGGHTNSKGFKTLNPRVGLIYGDSITLERASQILERLAAKGFASDNVVFGIGSYTYQHVTRDTFGFAMKSTWGQVNGEPRIIYKDPKTDNGTKRSLKGLIRVYRDADTGNFMAVDKQEHDTGGKLQTVYENGRMIMEPFNTIKNRLLNGK